MEGRLGRFIDKIRGKKPDVKSQGPYIIDPWPTAGELRQKAIEQAPDNRRRREERKRGINENPNPNIRYRARAGF